MFLVFFDVAIIFPHTPKHSYKSAQSRSSSSLPLHVALQLLPIFAVVSYFSFSSGLVVVALYSELNHHNSPTSIAFVVTLFVSHLPLASLILVLSILPTPIRYLTPNYVNFAHCFWLPNVSSPDPDIDPSRPRLPFTPHTSHVHLMLAVLTSFVVCCVYSPLSRTHHPTTRPRHTNDNTATSLTAHIPPDLHLPRRSVF